MITMNRKPAITLAALTLGIFLAAGGGCGPDTSAPANPSTDIPGCVGANHHASPCPGKPVVVAP
jgi:hypothetical protein